MRAPERIPGILRTICMRRLLALLITASALRAGTVAELISAIRTANGRPDPEVAAMVRQTTLTERLDDAAIEQLQSEGAGPRTVEELEWLREDSSGLPAAAISLFDGPPALTADEQSRLIERARAIALEYTATLPNFLCTESVQRFTRSKGKPWKATDSFTMDVGYSAKGGESYKLLTIDGKPTRKSMKDIGGFRSDGEFGSLLREIFRPDAAARFAFERWGKLRGRRVAVFSYRIDRANSKYTVAASTGLFRTHRILTGMLGHVYVDAETAQTLRFGDGDDGLPSTFPIRKTYSVLDYDFAEVGGQRFLLPRRVDLRIEARELRMRNVMEFGNYRKFSSDTTVMFEKQ
jgi:hypothetical protein